MNKVLFVTGHHGVGKTHLVNSLKSEFDIQHFDTGPIIRELFSRSDCSSIEKWTEVGEEQYGKDFTNQVLCEEMAIRGIDYSRSIVITGNRSLNGIKYNSTYFGVSSPNIIYLDASFALLKQNYEAREKISLSSIEFARILDKEIAQGLNQLKGYVLDNKDDCLYNYKHGNEDSAFSLVKKRFF